MTINTNKVYVSKHVFIGMKQEKKDPVLNYQERTTFFEKKSKMIESMKEMIILAKITINQSHL